MNYDAAVDLIKTHLDRKIFMIGLSVVAGLYVFIFLIVALNKQAILKGQEEALAKQTIMVPWKSIKFAEDYSSKISKDPEVVDIGSLSTDGNALIPAPIEGLYETTPLGRLPVINKEQNMSAFSAYKRSFPFYKTDKPLIMLGVMDLGLSAVATESAIRTMPADISLVFSPYASDMELWVNEARNRGHEVWLSMAFEPEDYPKTDTGPHTLLKGVPDRENLKKLRWLLGRTDGYVGFVGGKDTHFSSSYRDYKSIITKLYQRGLGFIDTSTDPSPLPQSMALSLKAGYGRVHVIIDEVPTQDGINAALTELEQIAQKQGYAVGLFSPIPLSYKKVLLWIKHLNRKGYVLAPLSASAAFADSVAN